MNELPFAIYVRVSEVGDREGESFGSPEEQEVAARAWTEREEVDVSEVVIELNVSGAKPVAERELGRLVNQVEAGEIGGIVVKFLDRFARDIIESAVLLKRIRDAGGRLIATANGFDTERMTPEQKMVYGIQMAIAEAQRDRNRLSRVEGSKRAAKKGYYLASRAPLGYAWSERRTRNDGTPGAGKLVPDKKTAPLVMHVFRARAEGESLRALAEWLRGRDVSITKSGVRAVLANRAYLGEATVPTERKGEVDVVAKAHDPLVTPEEWERANAAGGTYVPRNGRWASQALLRGIPACSGCGRRLSCVGGGSGTKVAYYSCSAEGCRARVGIRMERLDGYVASLLQDALLVREPHVSAIMEGDDRYARALEAVEAARVELETYRAEIKVSDVGAEQWKRDVSVRQAALDLARRELRDIPASKPAKRVGGTFEEALPELNREFTSRFIDRVIVKPVGRGRRVPVGERVDVWLVGSEDPIAYPISGAHGTVEAAAQGLADGTFPVAA